MKQNKIIIADGRWQGLHGIGRFSAEVLSRLQQTDILMEGPAPLSLKNLLWLPYQLGKHKNNYKVFYTPGFNPVIASPMPSVITIHDLIHLNEPGNAKLSKKLYYELFIKPAAKKAYKIITVSEYSKKTIMEWANIPDEKIVVVSNAISNHLTPAGARYQSAHPYLLHVGNTKSHKNVVRLLQALAIANIDSEIRLLLTGESTPELQTIIKSNKLDHRVIFCGALTDSRLAEYYRGAIAVTFPSLYEGFGLPVLEAMACGVPVLTSDVTSLPEVAGDAAVYVNPYEVSSIAEGLEKIVNDSELRASLIIKGEQRSKLFSWDHTAEQVQQVLDEASTS